MAAVVALLAALLVAVAPGTARADAYVDTLVIGGNVAADGTLMVTETMTFAGSAPGEVVQRLATVEEAMNGNRYNFDISGVTATSGTTDLAPAVSKSGDYVVITVKPGSASEPVVVSYSVKGAARATANNQTTLRWRVLQGLSLPVRRVTGTITVPATVNYVDCWAGPPGSPGKCQTYSAATHDSPDPTFTDGPRGAGEVVMLEMRFADSAVQANDRVTQAWSLDRAFSMRRGPLLAALLPLLLGALFLWTLHRKAGRDATGAAEPTRVAEFRPVGEGVAEFNPLHGIRPGHVGTLVDERVDPIDVTATLLDLAIRGHLLITEEPRGQFAHREWTFTRRPGSGEALRPFEATLLDAVAPADGQPVRASELPDRVAGVVGTVQGQLYDEMVSEGWYQRRPDDTRNAWGRIGWFALAAAVLATVLLVAFTAFGLLGLVLIALALGLLVVSQELPSRTAKGASLLAGLQVLRTELLSYPTDQMPKGREYEELSQVLPYAIVLGGRERWVSALVAADNDEASDNTDLQWYHAPSGWHLSDLPASLNSFITHVQGLLFSRA